NDARQIRQETRDHAVERRYDALRPLAAYFVKRGHEAQEPNQPIADFADALADIDHRLGAARSRPIAARKERKAVGPLRDAPLHRLRREVRDDKDDRGNDDLQAVGVEPILKHCSIEVHEAASLETRTQLRQAMRKTTQIPMGCTQQACLLRAATAKVSR